MLWFTNQASKSSQRLPNRILKICPIPEDMVLWNGAYMIFGITDLRGISDNPTFMVSEKAFIPEPSNNIGVTVRSTRSENAGYAYEEKKSVVSSSGIVTKLNWENADSFNGNVNIKLKLKGSNRLDFVPVGKTTNGKAGRSMVGS